MASLPKFPPRIDDRARHPGPTCICLCDSGFELPACSGPCALYRPPVRR